MSKKDYRVRNWAQYNKSMINRGRVTFWINDANDTWYHDNQGSKKRGRPFKYSDEAIIIVLTLKQVYHLTLRAAQGFAESLFEMMKWDLQVPSYSIISRRQKHLKLPTLPRRSQSIHMVVDSTGLKIFGEGEWKVRRFGYDKRRTWRKLHIGVDVESKLLVSSVLTENNCGDDKILPELLRLYCGKLHQVSADGGYDSHDSFNLISDYGAVPCIPTQPNPTHKRKTREQIIGPRDKVVWEIQEKGREAWKEESQYHKRSLAENAFYRYKKIFGDKLSSRKLENQKIEAVLRCHILNKMTLLGMPVSEIIQSL
jgi:hypothetical protein